MYKVDHGYWRNVWLKARDNTPQKFMWSYVSVPEATPDCTINAEGGCVCNDRCRYPYRHAFTAWGLTALLVGWPLYSPAGYSGHNRVYSATQRGNRPNDLKVRHRLAVLAGPMGKHLAWHKLQRLGIAHRYIKPY